MALLLHRKPLRLASVLLNTADAWLLWLEPLSLPTKDIRTSTVERYLNKQADFICMEDADYFAAFNLSKQTPVDLLGDLRGAYVSGEYLNYQRVVNNLYSEPTAYNLQRTWLHLTDL